MCDCYNFEFGFDNAHFSDRSIRIHLSAEEPVDSRTKRRRLDHDGRDVVNKTICISSLILASKSQFFYKLFSNGMLETGQKHVILQMLESEEAAFMDLLKYIYTNTLPRITPAALSEVLKAADKYDVPSCMEYCFGLLLGLPMTCEAALCYLDLPYTILVDDSARLLTDAAKECLVSHYKEIYKFEEEILNFPLVGIEAILSSNGLEVASEDCIYNFVMKWVRKHYTTLDERQEILAKRLLHLIRFPFMSCSKLEEVLTCSEINLKVSSQLVFQALVSKIPHRPLSFVPRAYTVKQVRIVRFNLPNKLCAVYLELNHNDCVSLSPYDSISSQHFELAGHKFSLMVTHHVNLDKRGSFGFYLRKESEGNIYVHYAIYWRQKPECEFVGEIDMKDTFAGKSKKGTNLFEIPYNNCVVLDDDILHFKVIVRSVE